jgi:hypothetical protein
LELWNVTLIVPSGEPRDSVLDSGKLGATGEFDRGASPSAGEDLDGFGMVGSLICGENRGLVLAVKLAFELRCLQD